MQGKNLEQYKKMDVWPTSGFKVEDTQGSFVFSHQTSRMRSRRNDVTNDDPAVVPNKHSVATHALSHSTKRPRCVSRHENIRLQCTSPAKRWTVNSDAWTSFLLNPSQRRSRGSPPERNAKMTSHSAAHLFSQVAFKVRREP